MLKVFNSKGIQKIDPGPITISNLDAVTFGAGKLNIPNTTDGLTYTLCCQSINGQPVLYLFQGGNARVRDGVYQIKNDTDGLWYPLVVFNVNGQAVISLGTGVV